MQEIYFETPCENFFNNDAPFFVFLWVKGHNANAIHSEMRPVYGDKWPNEENAGWTEICLRYGDAMGRSSVICAAGDLVFLHWAFTNLLKDGKVFK